MIKSNNGLLTLCLIILTSISCSKQEDKKSLTSNPQNPPHVVIAPAMSAQNLAQNMMLTWKKLKAETYDKKEYSPSTGKTTIRKMRYLPTDANLAFCFPDYKNQQLISNYDPYKTGFEIASVSKVFTSLWAVQALKNKYLLLPSQFKTLVTFNYLTGELFIRGNFDPMFGIDRLIDALQNIKYKLKEKNITLYPSVSKIHYYNFLQLPIFTSQASYELAIKESALSLSQNPRLTQVGIFNVAKYLKKEKNSFFTNTDLEKIEILRYSEVEKLEDRINPQESVDITSYQRPLNQLLYYINSFSHNAGSNVIFQLLGGKEAFFNFLINFFPARMSNIILHGEKDEPQHLGYDPRVPFAFYNGSGLPEQILDSYLEDTDILEQEDSLLAQNQDHDNSLNSQESSEDSFGKDMGSIKFRNKATCELMFKALEGLNSSRLFLKTSLEDLMPINGSGTLKRSVSEKVPQGTFIGKSGSLNNLLTLMGALKTRYGMRPFFISVFRNNLDSNGEYRANGLSGKASIFVRSKVTTTLVEHMLEYYSRQGFFLPTPDLLAQLNAQTFLSRSYIPISSFF